MRKIALEVVGRGEYYFNIDKEDNLNKHFWVII
jgi:hypothetical protein